MRLSELAVACFVYSRFTGYDRTYLRFLETTESAPDLRNAQHRSALLKWLRQWGCRQFAKAPQDEELASQNIHSWYDKFAGALPPTSKNLWEFTEPTAFDWVVDAYDDLRFRSASRKRHVGPAGTAKTLFALRPKALIPWDRLIRQKQKLDYRTNGASYRKFLHHARQEVEDLQRDCARLGVQLVELPQYLSRPNSTVPKLIDEYYYVTTRCAKEQRGTL